MFNFLDRLNQIIDKYNKKEAIKQKQYEQERVIVNDFLNDLVTTYDFKKYSDHEAIIRTPDGTNLIIDHISGNRKTFRYICFTFAPGLEDDLVVYHGLNAHIERKPNESMTDRIRPEFKGYAKFSELDSVLKRFIDFLEFYTNI